MWIGITIKLYYDYFWLYRYNDMHPEWWSRLSLLPIPELKLTTVYGIYGGLYRLGL